MSDDATKRSNAIREARATLLDSTALTGPRQPERPIDFQQLTLGGEEVQYNARLDAALRMGAFMETPGLPARLARTLTQAQKNGTISGYSKAGEALRAYANSPDVTDYSRVVAFRLADALLFTQAALGSAKAAAACAAICLLRYQASQSNGNHVAAWLAMRNAIRYSNNSNEELDESAYVTEDQASQLAHYDSYAHSLAETMSVVSAAQRQIDDQDDLLQGGVGAKPQEDVPADDLTVLGALDWPAGGGSGWRDKAPPRGPTLVVVPPKDVLPKAFAKEFEAIAGKALPLPPAPDPQAFLQAGIARAPWLEEILEILAHDLVGAPYAWLRPTLLLGGAGAGKTALARWIAEALGIPFRIYSVNATADGSYSGTNKQWSTARPSVTIQTLRDEVSPAALICLDELEKGTYDRRNGRFDEAILPFLERETSRRILDPGLECTVDGSAVTYIATANDLQGVGGPLRDRFRILRVPLLRRQDLPIVAANVVTMIREERGLSEGWLPDLEPDELALLGRHWKGGSLRPLRRLIETMLAGRERAARRH